MPSSGDGAPGETLAPLVKSTSVSQLIAKTEKKISGGGGGSGHSKSRSSASSVGSVSPNGSPVRSIP